MINEVTSIEVGFYKKNKFSNWEKGFSFNGGHNGIFDSHGRILSDYPYDYIVAKELEVPSIKEFEMPENSD